MTSPTMLLSDLDEYAETMVATRISMVPGVAKVQISGARRSTPCACRWTPTLWRARQIGLNEINDAINNWNVNLPTGTLFGPHTAYNVLANGQLRHAADYGRSSWPTATARRCGWHEVAHVIDSVQDDKQMAQMYGARVRQGGHQRGAASGDPAARQQHHPGDRSDPRADAVLQCTDSAQRAPDASAAIAAANIREAFQDIQFTMAATLGLVILVIFLFLRNISATMIPAMALPFSILGTFSVMYLLNFSMNNISMMALILSVGLRGGRRHRDAGEHRPAHRERREAAAWRR